MGLGRELGGPGVGDPDLKRAKSLFAQAGAVVGDPLADVRISHQSEVTCNSGRALNLADRSAAEIPSEW